MPTLAPNRVIELLEARDFNALRGTSEHEQVECKSASLEKGNVGNNCGSSGLRASFRR
jgi:hypothetical protein